MNFYKLKLNCTKHFWVVVRLFHPNWHVKDLANVTNQFLVSFSVLVAFWSLKQAKIVGEFCASYGKASWRLITWRIWALEHFKNPCQTWQGVTKTISSKMEENRAFRKAKSSIWQGVRKSLCARRPSGFFSRIVIFYFYSFCNR